MIHPEKWRETVDPFELPLRKFGLKEVLGYPHAGNDVFHVKGMFDNQEVEAFIKAARQCGADIGNEIRTISQLNWSLAPQIIDFDEQACGFVVTLAKDGERLSSIVGENRNLESLKYLYEYGQTLAKIHDFQGNFATVKDRRFFHIPEKTYFEQANLLFVYEYLTAKNPQNVDLCFCHGDFHYANILWEKGHISAVLDFELSGIGNKEFDIAWALIVRPGQKFLKTAEEQAQFRAGYDSMGKADWNTVCYYMVLIYSYFYKIDDTPEYRKYILEVFQRYCRI